MKRKYISPEIETIRLDNKISLQLASSNPTPGPELMRRQETSSQQVDSDPYQYENW